MHARNFEYKRSKIYIFFLAPSAAIKNLALQDYYVKQQAIQKRLRWLTRCFIMYIISKSMVKMSTFELNIQVLKTNN